jgi:hypothetical protein
MTSRPRREKARHRELLRRARAFRDGAGLPWTFLTVVYGVYKVEGMDGAFQMSSTPSVRAYSAWDHVILDLAPITPDRVMDLIVEQEESYIPF